MQKKFTFFDVFNYFFLGLVSLICLYPIIYVVMASFSNPSALMRFDGFLLWPLDFTTGSYIQVFKNSAIMGSFKNTFTVLGIGLAINMLLTVMGAYFFARKDIMLQKPMFFLIVLTMFINGGLIPTYLTVNSLGIDDTLWALILPVAVTTYNLIILKTGFLAVPEELYEAAKIDGAHDFTILFKIVLPLSKATLAVIFLYYAVQHWNAWFQASIYLRDKSLYPLQLVLRNILLANDTNSMMSGAEVGDQQGFSETIKYAVICVSTLPILCIYPFLQKYFASGVMIGAVKG